MRDRICQIKQPRDIYDLPSHRTHFRIPGEGTGSIYIILYYMSLVLAGSLRSERERACEGTVQRVHKREGGADLARACRVARVRGRRPGFRVRVARAWLVAFRMSRVDSSVSRWSVDLACRSALVRAHSWSVCLPVREARQYLGSSLISMGLPVGKWARSGRVV